MPPFVRERLRRARGLPEVAVLEQDGDRWRWPGGPDPLDAELVPTAMACASAAIVLDPARLLEALAWGTPSVTCADAAGQVGALASTHVLVGAGRRDQLSLARRLARDPALAAGLSWAGRRLVEQRHDVDSAAARLAELLGLRPPPPAGALAAASLQLALLGTPDGAAIRCRLDRAAACLHRNEVR
jgi:hypothetical protein